MTFWLDFRFFCFNYLKLGCRRINSFKFIENQFQFAKFDLIRSELVKNSMKIEEFGDILTRFCDVSGWIVEIQSVTTCCCCCCCCCRVDPISLDLTRDWINWRRPQSYDPFPVSGERAKEAQEEEKEGIFPLFEYLKRRDVQSLDWSGRFNPKENLNFFIRGSQRSKEICNHFFFSSPFFPFFFYYHFYRIDAEMWWQMATMAHRRSIWNFRGHSNGKLLRN